MPILTNADEFVSEGIKRRAFDGSRKSAEQGYCGCRSKKASPYEIP
jgi:hypothetical protein